MKEVTLKFREVAVDGLPEESMDVLILSGTRYKGRDRIEDFYSMTNTSFSKKHGVFNAHDYEETATNKILDDVLFWIPTSELDAMLEDSINAD